MLGGSLVALGFSCLALSAVLWTSCLRFTALSPFLLTCYLVAWAELLVLCLCLSAVSGLSRLGLTVGFLAWVGAASMVWRLRASPRPPDVAGRLRWLCRDLVRSELGVLGAALTAGYAYLIILASSTPQNDGDPLVYQLTRAAHWRQDGHIGVLGASTEPRLDMNPIVAETGDTVWLVLAGGERFVWIGQLVAVGALAAGAFALARRVGIDARGALVSAMVVPALPVVAMQAGTAYNDLVLASFVVTACVFVLGRANAEILGFVLAVALATGTKFTAPLLLPIVALVGALAQPARRWLSLLGAFAAGAALGGGWYVVNLARTGRWDGGLTAAAHQEPVRTVPGIVQSVERLVLDSLELPGTTGSGTRLMIAVGLTVAAVGVTSALRLGFRYDLVVAGLALAATPLVVNGLSRSLGTMFALPWDARGRTTVADEFHAWRPSTLADGAASWYGPLAAIIGAATVAACWRHVRRGSIGRAALAMALAPWLGILIVAFAVIYDPWRGRFLVAAWVMAIAMWGVLMRYRAVVLSVVLVTTVTFALSVVEYFGKPVGIDALPGVTGRSIWHVERWDAQTFLRYGNPREAGERLLIRAVERSVPSTDPVAVAVQMNDFIFPYFGGGLRRHVDLVGLDERAPSTADWLVAAPETSPVACPGAWRLAASYEAGWRLYERTASDRCAPSQAIDMKASSH